MRKCIAHTSLIALYLLSCVGFAQTTNSAPKATRKPVQLDHSFFMALRAAPKFASSNQLSTRTKGSIIEGEVGSVPHFSRSFVYEGQHYSYTMVGNRPQKGDTTVVDTAIAPVSFVFDGLTDQNGKQVVIEANSIVNNILHSPNFERATYDTGNTQFADAIQRAEFFSVMKKDWHTILKRPRKMKPVTLEVPAGSGFVITLPDGSFLALIDISFMDSQLDNMLHGRGVREDELPLLVSHNVLFGNFSNGYPVDCCIGGFHSAFETRQKRDKHFVQTFAFATSLDATVSDLIFGDPAAFADVNAISHEISEWMNDPFVNNFVPPWQPAGNPSACENTLETGDPIEMISNGAFPVTLHGFIYHPQSEALLQWFSRETPSAAFDEAYSYPDTTLLASPSIACQISAISFVQVGAATPQTPQPIVSVDYPQVQASGNMNIVVVGWNDATANVQSVTDSVGNTYQLAIGPTTGTGLRQSIYYAPNVLGGSNTVTVAFDMQAVFVDVRVLEYSGLDMTNPLDASIGAFGRSATAGTGFITTSFSSELVVAANTVWTGNKRAGTGFTVRIITTPDSDLAEDRIVAVPGNYKGSASLTQTGNWVMQVASFKAAGQ